MPDIGTRKLILKVAGTDFSDSVSNVAIKSGKKDSDFMSFADALAGGARQYTLALTLKQNTAAATLWYTIWSSLGTDVAIEIWPNGGTVASASTPKITGTATVFEPEGELLGGKANASNQALQTTDVEWTFTAKPTLVIT